MSTEFWFSTLREPGFATWIASRCYRRLRTEEHRTLRRGLVCRLCILRTGLLLIMSCCISSTLSGCGGDVIVIKDTGTLAASPTTVAFGNVIVGKTSSGTVSFRSGSSGAVQITQINVSGQSFAISSQADLPITVLAGETYDLGVQFSPVAMGTAKGQITVNTTSTTNGTALISLSGTGIAASYAVELSWDAPTSSADPVAGYNVYRALSGSSTYQLLNSPVDSQTTYTDSTVQNGKVYDYIVESVDDSGVESAPTSPVAVTIP